MKITGFEVIPFETFVDRASFGQLSPDHRADLPAEAVAPLHPR
jgi:hypothetical protein